VSCGQIVRSQWGVIVDPEHGTELADGYIGEIWLHGNNIGSGYWGRELETEQAFRNKLRLRLASGSHAEGTPHDGLWLRTGDLGVYLDGELYLTGRMKDLIIVDGRNHYPQDIEATVSESSRVVRSGYVAAFTVPPDVLPDRATNDPGERLVIIAERAAGAGRVEHAAVVADITAAVARRHAVAVADVRIVAAGSIDRTTSGKLARRACRASYLAELSSTSRSKELQ
jgi:acyl-CoA synthetase (AMP-forming)/AMP-acid ligase II